MTTKNTRLAVANKQETTRKRRNIIAPVLAASAAALALAAGGYLYLHRDARPAPPPLVAYDLRAVTVNLAGNDDAVHMMRVDPVLMVPAPAKSQVQADEYKIIDRVIAILRNDTYSQVMAPDGQRLLQTQVARAAAAVVPGVKKAYFTQLLVE